MATIAQLNVRLGLLSKEFERDLKAFETKMQATATRIGAAGEKLSLAFTLPLAGIGLAAVKTAADFEQLRLAMVTTLNGVGRGAADAEAEIEALRKAALAPGLDFEQALKGSVRLQGVGLSAEKARLILEGLGNALAASGGSAEQLDAVTKQFTQIIGKGRILQEDLTIILENMPALAKVLRDEFGTTSAEAIRALGVSAEDFIDRITNRMATVPRVAGGLANSIVNAGVAIRQTLATVGEALNRTFNISGNLDAFATWITDLADRFANLDAGTQQLILGVGVFVAALGPALKIMSLLTSGAIALVGAYSRVAEALKVVTSAGAGTLGLFSRLSTATKLSLFIGASGVILALAAAFAALTKAGGEASESQRLFADSQKEVTELAGRETAILNKNFEVLKNAASSTGERTAAIKELQATYPDYLRNVDLEKASLVQLTEIQGSLNAEILRSVAERQKAIAVEDQYSKAAQAQLRITQLRKQGFEALSGEEVSRAGRSLFGTDFEKQFVSAAARGRVVQDVIKALEQDVSRATKNANELAAQFDETFQIGTRAANRQYDALTRQRQAVIDAEDALENMTPAQQAALKFSEDWDRRWKANTSSISEGTKRNREQAELYRKALASIAAVAQKGDVLGAEFFTEQAREIESQIERLLENGFKPYSREILHLRDMMKKLRADLGEGFETPNITQQTLGFSLDIPKIEIPEIPQQVFSIDITPAKRAIEEITALQSAATQFIENQRIRAAEDEAQRQEDWRDGLKKVIAASLEAAQSIANSLLSIQQSRAKQEISALEEEYNAKIAAAQGNADKVAALQKELAARREQIELESAKKAKRIALINAAINIAEGITKALGAAIPPFNFILAGITAAAGAVQIAAISAQPLAKGGVIDEPTLALVGEYPGAKSNPEIVTPENKMREVFQGVLANFANLKPQPVTFNTPQMDGQVVNPNYKAPNQMFDAELTVGLAGQFLMKGEDMLLVVDKAAARRGRIR